MWTWEQPVGSIPPGFSFSSSLNSCPDFTNGGLWPASGSQSQINPFFPKLLLRSHCSIPATESKRVQYVSPVSSGSSVLSGQWTHLPTYLLCKVLEDKVMKYTSARYSFVVERGCDCCEFLRIRCLPCGLNSHMIGKPVWLQEPHCTQCH